MVDNLQAEIRRYQDGINATPEDQYGIRAGLFKGVGRRYMKLYEMTKSADDLDKAIRHREDAVSASKCEGGLAPVDHLMNLRDAFILRYNERPSLADLDMSIRALRDIVDIYPLAGMVRALGQRIRDRYLWTGSMNDLIEAIGLLQKVVDYMGTNFDAADRAVSLYALGFGTLDLHEEKRSSEDLEKAICIFQEALDCLVSSLRQANGTPFERVKSGIRAGNIAIHEGRWEEAARYLAESIDILPRVVIRSNSSNDHQDNLKQLSNLGPLAASVFIKAGKSALESLQALEKARDVIASLAIDSRSDISLLRERYPDLCSEYQGLRDIVATSSFSQAHVTPFSMSIPPEDYASISLHRSQTITKMGEIEDKIRTMSGFERFHLAPTEEGLCDLARDGLLVSYNITELGSHAFIISIKGVEVLPLPQFPLKDLKEYVWRMQGGNEIRRDVKAVSVDGHSTIERAKTHRNPCVPLWNVAVEPVLVRAGLLTDIDGDGHFPLPCVWWVGGRRVDGISTSPCCRGS